MFTLSRYLRLLKGYSWSAAQQYAKNLSPDWTLVNTAIDFNQNKWLGIELSHTLIYFDEQTPLNHLLSILGCIRGGSVILLAYPNQLTFQSDYFFSSVLLPALQAIECQQALDEQSLLKQSPSSRQTDVFDLNSFEKNIIAKLTAKQTIPIHVVGPRGTGKSTLVGYAIAQLLASNQRVLLCAPSRKSAENAIRRLPKVPRETFGLITPWQLIDQMTAYDRLVIDEAASLPRGLLNQVISLTKKQNKALILTTTTEGYEGTGQSYRLSHLNEDNCQVIHLTTPKRFIADKLHQLTLSLAQPIASPCTLTEGVYLLTTRQLIRQQLVEACYILLREAHYKTTPNDLVRFYNHPAVYAISVKDNQLIGAARCQHEAIEEKGLTAQAIYHGERRCKNALTQQAIIQAYGQETQMESMKILRIERIAIHADYRRQGLASHMIIQIKQYAKNQGYHFLSTSYSASQPNYLFWKKQDFEPVRLGLYKNKWLNQYALLMLFALHPQARQPLDSLLVSYTNHLAFYREIYPDWLVVEQTPEVGRYSITAEQLDASITSVVDYHRDINWLLPELNGYAKSATPVLPTTIQAHLNGQLIKKSAWPTVKADLIRFRQARPTTTQDSIVENQ